MRTAICLYGLVGGKSGKDGSGEDIPFEKCYASYKKHIIDINNADVFIHSWSQHLEDDITDLYKPKLYQFQKQKMFEKEIDMPARITKVPPENRKSYRFRSLSRWYSVKQVLKLKSEYEYKNGFQYDCVMITRFDTLFFVDLDFNNYKLEYLYAPHWNSPQNSPYNPGKKADRINRSERTNAFLDMWFFSNSTIMDVFAKIYDGIRDGKYDTWQHRSAWDCLIDNGYSRKNFKYIFYRYFDFELYRWYKELSYDKKT